MSSAVRDNWATLVAAVVKREDYRRRCLAESRSPSILSESSDYSCSLSLNSSLCDVAFDFLNHASSSQSGKDTEEAPWQELSGPKLVFMSDFNPAFDFERVGRVSFNLLGTGTFGRTYSVGLGDKIMIVVKMLRDIGISEPEFKRNMAIVGNINYENVLPLRAYFSSSSHKLLLYDHCSDGSVFTLIHGQSGDMPSHVDWKTRLCIAVGTARGIAEIHTHDGGELVHGNIKSSNIFLNSKHYGCISDLGLANINTAKMFKPPAWCYAPEVMGNRDVSQASDVYSFGVLILELLTGVSPISVAGGPLTVDLVKVVTSFKTKEWIFDAHLPKPPAMKEQMVKMLKIGLKCVRKSVEKRPKMSEVVKMLENVDIASMGTPISLQQKLVFYDDDNPAFGLADMLGTPAELLGKGQFAKSYKAVLAMGKTIVVKRIKDVTATSAEVQQHMNAIGRMRNKNVARLQAYHLSRGDLLLVYDHYNLNSLSALLYGEYAERLPLRWEARKKIALRAAKGVAHIHRQLGGTLVHGNIRASNIFHDGIEYGLVSEVGIPKLINPVEISILPDPGYFAPEVSHTGELTQASDVYSFGVVLLQLISGKKTLVQYCIKDDKIVSLVNWFKSINPFEWFDRELMIRGRDAQWFLQITMDCIATAPECRPKMSEVVKRLEGLNEMYTLKELMESTLEDLLENFPI